MVEKNFQAIQRHNQRYAERYDSAGLLPRCFSCLEVAIFHRRH